MKKRTILLLIMTITACCGFLTKAILTQGKQDMQAKTMQAMKEAIDLDYHRRLSKENIYVTKNTKKEIKGYQIQVGEKFERITFKDSLDAQIAFQRINQYMLATSHPLSPDTLNHLFIGKLSTMGIATQTGIIYRHGAITRYSGNDSILPRSAFKTPIEILYTDNEKDNEISVQGWADYDWSTWVRHADTKNLWIILACYTASMGVLLFKLKKKKEAEEPATETNEEQETDCTSTCEAGKIRLDLKDRQLFLDGVEHHATNMNIDLLKMFLKAPDHYLSREEIRLAFWPKEEEVDDRINTQITSLRQRIKPLPGYEIKVVKGKGYRLVIPDEE